jgi:two-component system phosphate regulon sensor histidine kinase PhoR
MKNRNTVLILGITSILILISVQVFIITGVWKQKNELFAIKYFVLSQEAIYNIRREMSTDGFDTVRLLLDQYSEEAVKGLRSLSDKKELLDRKKDILDYFNKVVNQEQDLSELLSKYFESRGVDKNFKYKIIINNVELINNDTIIIYQKEGFSTHKPPDRGRRNSPMDIYSSSILVRGGTQLEGNNYRFNFDYYIDFSDKQKVILKETSAALGWSTLSILLVGIMFMITYRNLMEEKRLSNLKTDFINNMTHELKTPLSTITVAGKTLEMPQIRSDDAKILETAKLIGKQSVHLNQLINMILEISMWERTQFQLDKRTVDIEEIMNDVVDSFKSGGGNNASISQKYDFRGAKVDLDVVYFTTLLNNLLSNAVKYSDKQPVIDIEGFTQDNNLYIKVSDNGIGINKIDQKHIFDKFYRASTGNIHKFKGLGLGLYYVKKIAEAHGGDVAVNSKPGKGSIFTVTLPNN